jgi:hypothetical protein
LKNRDSHPPQFSILNFQFLIGWALTICADPLAIGKSTKLFRAEC